MEAFKIHILKYASRNRCVAVGTHHAILIYATLRSRYRKVALIFGKYIQFEGEGKGNYV